MTNQIMWGILAVLAVLLTIIIGVALNPRILSCQALSRKNQHRVAILWAIAMAEGIFLVLFTTYQMIWG